jgi:serine/threonine-protein phosphatase 6 regulatory ankyrin repeat subunit A/serine/threonine-protein phosphatase 6 regulatory ankyrin repeat subunit B
LILKLKIIKLLINAGANFNTDYMGFHSKALINAAEMGDKVMARLLIKAGGDVKNSRALTNTIGCYNYDNEDKKERVVKLLISLGANVNTKDEQGRTALMEAARNGYEKMVQLLIDNGADVRNSTALIDAVGGYSYDEQKKERIVMMLIRSGANVNTKDEWGRTALMEAARNGCESIVQLLIDNGADVKNSTALISAVGCYGNDEDKKERIVMLLIRSGANVNAKDKQGRTALMEAARNGCETIVPLLINNGADVKNSTALIDAVESYGNDEDKKERIVMLLIRSRANVNAKDEQGRTALLEAARNGYEKMVQLLIDNGTDVNAATMAIRAAVKIGNERIVKLLIDAGADINTYNTSTRNKLLYKALIMGKEGIVKLLLNAGVSVGKDDLRQAQWRVSKETRNLMETVAFFRSC